MEEGWLRERWILLVFVIHDVIVSYDVAPL